MEQTSNSHPSHPALLWLLLIPFAAIAFGAVSVLWLVPLGVAFWHLAAAVGGSGETTSGSNPGRSFGAGAFDDSDWPTRGLFSDADTHAPAFNIDGTPMMGALDINGNAYGFTGNSWQPSVNIDGTPMVGSVDIHGHPYGVTDSWDSGNGIGMDDTWSTGSSIGTDDSWSTAGSSTGLDDAWHSCGSSDFGCGGGLSHWD